MGPVVLFHVALVGFFTCASVYAAWRWWLSREERTLLIFSLQCLLCSALSVAFVRLATAQSLATASSALMARMIAGLFAMAATAFLIGRVTGLRARAYCWSVLLIACIASVTFVINGAPSPPGFTLRQATLPWGEVISSPVWARPPWYQTFLYFVVASVDVYGLVGGIRLASRDRIGGTLIGLAATTGLVAAAAGFGSDRGHYLSPYLGNIPFAFWVVLLAVQLSRDNARMRLHRLQSDQRLRAIFDHTLHFMGLLDINGTVLEANRAVLEAAGVSPDAVLGKPFWTAPFWEHSAELRERVKGAVAAAAAGTTIRFETSHPRPDGTTGHVDFSLKPVHDERGRVVLLIPEGWNITARKKTQEALDRMVDVISPRTGEDFFHTVVHALCEICEVDFAVAAGLDPLDPNTVRTIAVSRRGEPADNFAYARRGTPCDTVIEQGFVYYPENVQAQFPEDTLLAQFGVASYMGIPLSSAGGGRPGLIALMHRAPFRHPGQARALLHVVTARAAAELERRRADAALQESESRFRALIQDLDVGVLLWDAHDRILVSNPAAARMLELSQEQLHGATSRTERELVKEDGTRYAWDDLPSKVAARTLQPVRNAIVGITARLTGARTWMQVTATPHLQKDGALQHVLVTLVDVTDRKRAEDAVRSSSRRLALAISATSDAVWEWNYQTGEAYCSPRWFEMLGLPSVLPVTIDTWKALCHPDDLRPALNTMEAALQTGHPSGYEVEFRMRRADGTWAWILARGNAVEWDAAGRPVVVAGTNTDITQRKEAETRRRELEAQLAQARRMEAMGRLAGGIAHDFNNILTVINGYSDLLLRSKTLDAESIEMLEDVRDAGDRAASLTRQLLTFSRNQVQDPDIVPLNAVVADTERMLQRLIGEHIRLQTVLDEAPLWVRGDAGQLGQVVVNLVVNARDAMPEGGTLTLRTSLVMLDTSAAALSPDAHPGRYAVLAVTDTGTGIPPEVQELVFEPFFTTKGPGRGTGLGLTTVHGIVRQCGGFLLVKSQPDAGSTFTVYLPALINPDPDGAPESEHAAPVAAPKTVLMVEDELPVRAVVRTMLHRMGFEVMEAASAEGALRLVDAYAGPIDLLLTDVIMPGLNGRQLAERLIVSKPGLRVLYMSGYTDDAIVQHVVKSASAAYLQKPFDAETLAKKVRQALEAAPPAAIG